MVNNNPYYPNWYQQQNAMREQAGQLRGRPVTSIEEVKGTSVDFDGSVFYFPDLANKKIYTKQINPDGTSTINLYELKPIPQPPVINPSQYITREEFETAMQQLQQQLRPAATPIVSAPQQAQKSVQSTPPQTLDF